MKRKNLLVFIFSVIAIAAINTAYGFSIHKPGKNNFETAKYFKISEVVKLSATQFGELTGKKMNLWDRASFTIAKIKMNHDLKKNPNLTLMDYTSTSPFLRTTSKVLKIIYWILIVFLLLFLILVLAGSK